MSIYYSNNYLLVDKEKAPLEETLWSTKTKTEHQEGKTPSQ